MTYIKDNPIIKKRFDEKMKRLDKTSASILISWAINNAVNMLSNEMKDKLRGDNNNYRLKETIQNLYPVFIELYREWMLENMPIEAENGEGKSFNSKLTEEQVKSQSEGQKWQDNYNAASETDEANRQIQETLEVINEEPTI